VSVNCIQNHFTATAAVCGKLGPGIAFEKKIRFMLFTNKTLHLFIVYRYLEFKRYTIIELTVIQN